MYIDLQNSLLRIGKSLDSGFGHIQVKMIHKKMHICIVMLCVYLCQGKNISEKPKKTKMIMFLKKSGRLPMSFQKWHMPTFLSWKMCHSLIRDLLLLFGQRSAAKTLFLFLFQNDQSCDFASGIGSE